jgi:hypothetical protein
VRRAAVPLLLAVALAAAPSAGAAPDTRTYRIADVKLSFAVPATWVRLTLRDGVGSAGERLRRESPHLAMIHEAMTRAVPAARLVAYDPSTRRGFVTNVNVIVTRVPAGLGFDQYLRLTRAELLQLPGLVASPAVRATTLPAGPAARSHLRATVVVDGRRVVGDVTQFAFLRDGRSIVLSFTSAATAAARNAPVVARSAASIRFG